MIKNYLKIAWRNISKHKSSSVINILGLAFGICACIVIFLITSYELSFDNFHPGKERIYRVMGDVTENTGNTLHFARLARTVSENGRSEITGLDAMAGIIPYNAIVTIPGSDDAGKHFESRIDGKHYPTTVIAEPQYFDIFKYTWLAGNPATALQAPFSVVLTHNKANQYFGAVSPDKIIGKKIIYGDSLFATVSGIIKEWRGNTDLAFTDFISASTLQSGLLKKTINTDSWTAQSMNTWTFAKLSKTSSPKRINDQMELLVKKHAGSEIKLGIVAGTFVRYSFQPGCNRKPDKNS